MRLIASLERRVMLLGGVVVVSTVALFFAFGVHSLVLERVFADPAAPNPGHAWDEVEYHDTTGGGDYWLGPTVDKALELHVNNARALRLEPDATSPNVIGGYSGNSVTSGYAVTISGGGTAADPNSVDANGASIGGGWGNTASGGRATIGGGAANIATGWWSTVGGGGSNTANEAASAIGGGRFNTVSASYATIAGGGGGTETDGNTVTDDYGTVGGGQSNQAGDATGDSTTATHATVGGGYSNKASGVYSTVAGGDSNDGTAFASTVGGGFFNDATAHSATVGGGNQNNASGLYSTVPGGNHNEASGDYSFAAGTLAKADDEGAFVWADSNPYSVYSPGVDTFSVRASGGIWLGTTSSPSIPAGRFINTSTGGYLTTGGTWTDSSDVALKENFASVNGQDLLARVAALPITTWNHKKEEPSTRHMGPTAQDFYMAFGLGADDEHIAALDSNGVSLAAIQGLYEVVQELQAENQALEARVSALEESSGTGALVSRASSSGFPAIWVVAGGGLALVVVGLALVRRRLAGGRS